MIAETNGISIDESSMAYENLTISLTELGLQDSFPPSTGITKLTPKTITQQFINDYPELKTELEIYVQVLIAEIVSGKTSMFTVDNEEIKSFKDQFTEKFLTDKTDDEKVKALTAASRLLRYKPRQKAEVETESEVEQPELIAA